MDGLLPSVFSKSRKRNCKYSKGRSIRLFIVWSSTAGSKQSGRSAKPVGRQSSIHSRARGENTWRKRRRTGIAYPGRLISLFGLRQISLMNKMICIVAARGNLWRTAVSRITAAVDPGAPSIFTALQEQLGLRLEPARAPLPVLIIDSVDKPAEN